MKEFFSLQVSIYDILQLNNYAFFSITRFRFYVLFQYSFVCETMNKKKLKFFFFYNFLFVKACGIVLSLKSLIILSAKPCHYPFSFAFNKSCHAHILTRWQITHLKLIKSFQNDCPTNAVFFYFSSQWVHSLYNYLIYFLSTPRVTINSSIIGHHKQFNATTESRKGEKRVKTNAEHTLSPQLITKLINVKLPE